MTFKEEFIKQVRTAIEKQRIETDQLAEIKKILWPLILIT